jgi:hypothetical protein
VIIRGAEAPLFVPRKNYRRIGSHWFVKVGMIFYSCLQLIYHFLREGASKIVIAHLYGEVYSLKMIWLSREKSYTLSNRRRREKLKGYKNRVLRIFLRKSEIF